MRLALVLLLTAGTATAQTGRYTVSGTNPGGSGVYGGRMAVLSQGDAYRVVWNTGGAPVEGIGVRVGSVFSVAYGGACGVVAYTPADDGDYEAVWATMGGSDLGSEVARPDGPEGSYRVAGTVPGSDAVYTGTLQMDAGRNASALRWDVGGSVYEGIGLAVADVLGAAYGAETCSVAVYEVRPDGTLDGVWTTPGAGGVGTERATPG
jgi:hypothetical protein